MWQNTANLLLYNDLRFIFPKLISLALMFLSCYTGLAYADVKKLSHDDIHTDERGDLWIVDHRQKTGTQFRVKLLPVAKRLVERYRHLHLPGSCVFPVKDRDSMNMSLRHVARHAGLSFNPTMHEARHTFSNMVTLSQGVPLETVSKMLGHKHITTTQIYTKITNDKIGRDTDALVQKITEKFYAYDFAKDEMNR